MRVGVNVQNIGRITVDTVTCAPTTLVRFAKEGESLPDVTLFLEPEKLHELARLLTPFNVSEGEPIDD